MAKTAKIVASTLSGYTKSVYHTSYLITVVTHTHPESVCVCVYSHCKNEFINEMQHVLYVLSGYTNSVYHTSYLISMVTHTHPESVCVCVCVCVCIHIVKMNLLMKCNMYCTCI